jgi:hypothetical protein
MQVLDAASQETVVDMPAGQKTIILASRILLGFFSAICLFAF